MSTLTPEGLRERALAALGDIDLKGFADVAATLGTPLYDSAQTVLPGARTVAVLGMEVFAEVAALIRPDKQVGEAAARELYAPHVDYLNGRLNRGLYELARVLRAAGHKAVPLPSLGTPVDGRYQRALLSFKHAAEYAGLGRIGRSSLLITEEFGPRVRLACLVTDAALGSTRRQLADPCAECAGDCVAGCPAGALAMPAGEEPYHINKYACCAFRAGSGMCSTCLANCSKA
ncbi:MAG: 4Fe-4S binding protein [Chloroflexota bacterium]